MIGELIRRERGPENHKLVHRLWKEEGLQRPKRKSRTRYLGAKGEVKEEARYPNYVWSYDFAEDGTTKDIKVRILASPVSRAVGMVASGIQLPPSAQLAELSDPKRIRRAG